MLLGCTLVGSHAAAAAPSIIQEQTRQDTTAAARSLVPLLKDVRKEFGPRVTVEPGTLPPSPFTGRNSTLVAVRIGVTERHIDQKVVDAIDGLLRWNMRQPLSEADAQLVDRWLDALRTNVLAKLAAAGVREPCDEVCVVQRLTNPDGVFGDTRRLQQETRNDILLEAMIDAVEGT